MGVREKTRIRRTPHTGQLGFPLNLHFHTGNLGTMILKEERVLGTGPGTGPTFYACSWPPFLWGFRAK